MFSHAPASFALQVGQRTAAVPEILLNAILTPYALPRDRRRYPVTAITNHPSRSF